ncbi:MAG: hypothetical protein NT105_18730 [Verrucomicrobia bacterium]|nr:hypothetical protein [Verrucomicrobiota bacterium]
MKTAELKRLFRRYISPAFPSLRLKGHLIYVAPVEAILRGFCFDTSAFDRSFTIECFIQPLYIPCDHLVFSFGSRLGKDDVKWLCPEEESEESLAKKIMSRIQNEGIPFLDTIKTPHEFLLKYGPPDNPDVLHEFEAVAFSMCYENPSQKEVEGSFRSLFKALERHMDTDWVRKMHVQAEELLTNYRKSPAQAKALLNRWIEHTKSKLGLTDADDQPPRRARGL